MTKNNKLICDIVNTADDHPSADQIFMRAKQQNPKVVLATVYNNLNSLVNDGKIRRISIAGKPDCYDNIVRHDHVVCIKCGTVSDIMIDDITEEIKEKLGDGFVSYDLSVSYICGKCREE